jgi:hypothetical protein
MRFNSKDELTPGMPKLDLSTMTQTRHHSMFGVTQEPACVTRGNRIVRERRWECGVSEIRGW